MCRTSLVYLSAANNSLVPRLRHSSSWDWQTTPPLQVQMDFCLERIFEFLSIFLFCCVVPASDFLPCLCAAWHDSRHVHRAEQSRSWETSKNMLQHIWWNSEPRLDHRLRPSPSSSTYTELMWLQCTGLVKIFAAEFFGGRSEWCLVHPSMCLSNHHYWPK